MAGNDSSQVVGGRSLKFFDAPYASGNALPPDSTAYGTDWASPWINRGFTRDGLRVTWRRQFVEWDVDQEIVPVLRTPDAFDMRMAATLAQFDVTALKAATQQGTTATTGVTPAANTDYTVTGEVTVSFVSIGFDVLNPGDQLPIRMIGQRAIPVGDLTFGFTPRPPGAGINYEGALTPDSNFNPAQVAVIRDVD